MVPFKADEPPACAAEAAQALSDQTLGISYAAGALANGQPTAEMAPYTTDPSITAYTTPGSKRLRLVAGHGPDDTEYRRNTTHPTQQSGDRDASVHQLQ